MPDEKPKRTVHKVQAIIQNLAALPMNADGSRGDPARERADSIVWLEGDTKGPVPNHLITHYPEDRARSETRERDPLIVSDDPAVMRQGVRTFILESEKATRMTLADMRRRLRKERWQTLISLKADAALKTPGDHRLNARKLTLNVCKLVEWDPEEKFKYDFDNQPYEISVDEVSRYLSTSYQFPHRT